MFLLETRSPGTQNFLLLSISSPPCPIFLVVEARSKKEIKDSSSPHFLLAINQRIIGHSK